jgi:hypothetical protein
MPDTATDRPVRLLHLSDFQFRADRAGDAALVLRDLARFIRAEVAAGLVPDLVVITGDLGYSGKTEDYQPARKRKPGELPCSAQEWLEEQLWPAVSPDPAQPLPRDCLLLVPGNHDVDRRLVSRAARSTQADLLTDCSQGAIAEVLGDADDRGLLLKRHAAHLKFYGTWLDTDQPDPWWQRGFVIRGEHLHIAGLNSAWMAYGDEDRGRLLLGHYQVSQTVLHQDAEGADWRLALMHHPWDYLAAFDAQQARGTIHLHCDLLLHGHRREPEASRVVPPDSRRACLELAAGCICTGSGDPSRYQWIELYPNPRRVRVLFRFCNQGAWQPDYNQPGDDDHDGTVDFPLDQPVTAIDATPAARRPEVPAAYLDWLRRTYAGFELLGQDAPQGQAIRLSQVYVPALTTPAAPGPADGSRRGPPNANPDPDLMRQESRPSLLLTRLDAESLYCPAPPGGGKTTFCHWALLQAIPGGTEPHPIAPPDGFAEPVPDQLRGRLPLFVPLREFWRGMDQGHGRRIGCRVELEQALADWVDRVPPDGLTGPLLKAHLERGSAFLLLDGLDEVPPTEQRDGRTIYPRALLLSGLADALPGWQAVGNRVLLTSRPYGLHGADLARLGLPSAPLEPLPEPLQSLFVTRWFHTLQKPSLA